MAVGDSTILYQYGALPYTLTEQEGIRILLVTTRGRRNWIIPKGWPIRNLTAAATAAREAYEEAGLIGAIVGDAPLGYFRYQKPRNSRRVTICEVSVFLFAVEGRFASGLRDPNAKHDGRTRGGCCAPCSA